MTRSKLFAIRNWVAAIRGLRNATIEHYTGNRNQKRSKTISEN